MGFLHRTGGCRGIRRQPGNVRKRTSGSMGERSAGRDVRGQPGKTCRRRMDVCRAGRDVRSLREERQAVWRGRTVRRGVRGVWSLRGSRRDAEHGGREAFRAALRPRAASYAVRAVRGRRGKPARRGQEARRGRRDVRGSGGRKVPRASPVSRGRRGRSVPRARRESRGQEARRGRPDIRRTAFLRYFRERI